MQAQTFYLVDWNNGFIGGFDENYQQMFNTTKNLIFDDIVFYKFSGKILKIITPSELDNLRGYHKMTF